MRSRTYWFPPHPQGLENCAKYAFNNYHKYWSHTNSEALQEGSGLSHNLTCHSNGICLDVSCLDSCSNITMANSRLCFTVNKRLPFSTVPPSYSTASQKFKYVPVKFPVQRTNASHFLDSFYNGIVPFASPSPSSIQIIIFNFVDLNERHNAKSLPTVAEEKLLTMKGPKIYGYLFIYNAPSNTQLIYYI